MKNYFLIFFIIANIYAVEITEELKGYVRLQTSLQNGKENLCFKIPNAGTKYRLGNECETWLELDGIQTLVFANGIKVTNHLTPTFVAPNAQDVEFLQWDEVYSEISNLYEGSPSVWVGRRFYKRYDSHLSDYFYFNMSGQGVGIDNIQTPYATLAYSFNYDLVDPSNISGSETILYASHDIRALHKYDRGDITLFINYMTQEDKTFSTGTKFLASNGLAVGVLYEDKLLTQELFGLSGNNITAVFYGQGAAKNAGQNSAFNQSALIEKVITNNKSLQNSQTYKVINYNAFENTQFGVMSNFVFEYVDNQDFDSQKQNWVSFGVRPYLFFHENMRLVLESGYDRVQDLLTTTAYSLFKNTVALEAALKKGVWERPVLRVFYTYALWSQSAKGSIASSVYSDKTSGSNLGVQFEYWW